MFVARCRRNHILQLGRNVISLEGLATMRQLRNLVLFLGCGVLQVSSQATLQRHSHSPPEYVLGPGDQIAIHVEDMEDISAKAIRIDPSGYIDLPLAGRTEAAGLTIEQLRAELTAKLSKYITTPNIALNIIESASQPVSVIGQVNNPGVHQLGGSRRLLEVISLSGGLKPDAGPNVIVTRDPRYGAIQGGHARTDPGGYSIATFSLDSLLTSGSPDDNIVIQPNDVVSVPKAELVYVLGDVRKAGGFQLSTHPTVSLLQAVSLAEGLGPDNSASHARILRKLPGGDGVPREIPVDINSIMAGKSPDIALLPDDVLFVPHSGVKVAARRVMETAIGLSTAMIYRY